MVQGRISNALLAATLQMEENRLWSIKMKLDVSRALKSQREKKKLFLGHFVVVNWSEQLAVMQVMELLSCFHLQGLCVHACVCVWEGRASKAWPNVGSKMTVGMKEASRSEGACAGELFFQHLLAPFTAAAVKQRISVRSMSGAEC